MDKKELTRECIRIENQILKIDSNEPDVKPIIDGIINIDEFLSSKFKIMWILKEPNGLQDNKGGGWSSCDAFNNINWENQPRRGKMTLQRIIYVTYGILNNFMAWQDIHDISQDPNVCKIIRKIAFINVNKLPGGNIAYETQIKNRYDENKELLLDQIKTYDPDIIIGGSTLHYFKEDLHLPEHHEKLFGARLCYMDSKKLYIDAYHPDVRASTIDEGDYCNAIIQAVKNWANNWKQ